MADKEKSKILYESRKKQGLCVRCGKPSKVGYTKCEPCIEKANANMKRHYIKSKESEFCVICKVNKKQNKLYCHDCQRKNSERFRQLNNFYRENGICPYCKTNNIVGKEYACIECKVNRNIYYEKTFDREKFNQKARERYQKRKEDGICNLCRKRKTNGFTFCETCRAKMRIKEREKRAKKTGMYIPRSERQSYGLCYFCGDPVGTKSNKLCDKHYFICSSRHSNLKNADAWKKDNDIVFKNRKRREVLSESKNA